jgi:polysaccharide pyruvyl transferase WcaK-like protein
MKKIALIWANPYSDNFGVAALGYSSLFLLNSIVNENNLKAKFTIIGSMGPYSDELIIGNEKLKVINLKGHNLLSIRIIIRFLLSPKQFNLFKIIRQQIVFDLSGGDSFSDIYGMNRFNAILNSKILFNKFGIRQVMMPQTIGPFINKKNEYSAIDQINKIDLVFVRDNKSYDYISSLSKNGNIYNSIDVAFLLPFKKNDFNNNKINVGLNVSGLLWNGGYTKDNQFNLKADYKKLISLIIAKFNSFKDVRLHLISHVIPTDDDNIESDYGISMKLNNENINVVLAPRFNDPVEAKSYISGLDFFIGARMHACIAAFSSNVPVYPIAYSRKFTGLFNETLNYSYVGNCISENEYEILDNLIDTYRNRIQIKNLIEKINTQVVEPKLNELKVILRQYLKDA